MTDRLVIERRARSTGTTVLLVDRGGSEGWGDWRWETICEEHGGVCSHETRKLAESFLSHPEEWCEDCMASAAAKSCPRCGSSYSVFYAGKSRCPCGYVFPD